MGIVLKQSFYNTLILFIGFAIGAINVLFLYTHFLQEDYYGLITFLLSSATLILPLVTFGMQHTVVKFFSSYKTKQEQDSFLVGSLFIPFFLIIPITIIGSVFYNEIAVWLSKKNTIIKEYTYLIGIIAFFMAYFELFYAWCKVRLQSVFGNFIREVFARLCIAILLVAVYLKLLTEQQFIYAVVVVYGIRTLLIKSYAFSLYMPKFTLKLPANSKQIFTFSFFMLAAGSASGILLEIDKFMIPQIQQIAQVAYYSVGVYIASVIAIPTRAMQQITSPITAKELNNNNLVEVEKLYKKTSINLLLVGGLLFLLINVNITELYQIINKPEFSKGVWVVLIISVAKLTDLLLGTANAIIVNSSLYKTFFLFSVAMAISVILLNNWLINLMGINGAALATLLVVLIFATIKILFLYYKLKIHPLSIKTLKLLLIIGVLYFTLFKIELNLSVFVSILIKSILVVISYLFTVKVFRISSDFDKFYKK